MNKSQGGKKSGAECDDVENITGSLFENRKEEAIENYAINVIKTINGR